MKNLSFKSLSNQLSTWLRATGAVDNGVAFKVIKLLNRVIRDSISGRVKARWIFYSIAVIIYKSITSRIWRLLKQSDSSILNVSLKIKKMLPYYLITITNAENLPFRFHCICAVIWKAKPLSGSLGLKRLANSNGNTWHNLHPRNPRISYRIVIGH